MSSFFAFVYVVVFFASVYIGLKFEWSKEGKDERGRSILNSSYRISLPLLPIGWLALELIDDFIYEFTYDEYRRAIWFLVTGIFILHALCITILRRRV